MSYRSFLLLLLLGICRQSDAQAPSYWQQQVNYTIDVTLNDADHTLDGFVRMQYSNHSPDTLSFIWIHLWPNAFKNDRTAFSEQLLSEGRTDFYFSDKEKKGYINHLDFRVDGQAARMEDHPLYIDIIRIWLPRPLPPGGQITITTPFHEKLPANFSRGGYLGSTCQVTQWYPKPAVYDRNGWHPIPYLDQGEFYSEYGDFDVRITLPRSYTVAATGELQPSSDSLNSLSPSPDPTEPTIIDPTQPISPLPQAPVVGSPAKPSPTSKHPSRKRPSTASSRPSPKHSSPKHPSPGSASSSASKRPSTASRSLAAHTPPPARLPVPTRTLHYLQKNVHDFAWFADPRFHKDHDTLRLPSGRIIDICSYYTPRSASVWHSSIRDIKDAVRFRSALLGEYPFNTVSVAEAVTGSSLGGMEYPTIAAIAPQRTEKDLDLLIEHEVGHNWFYAALGTDERRYPWMDEGMNTWYDHRYEQWKYPAPGIPAPTSLTAPVPAAPSAAPNPALAPAPTAAPGSHPPSPGTWDWLLKKLPADPAPLYINTLAKQRKDQPISTSSEDFTRSNYELIAYDKAAAWMQQLQDSMGAALFDTCMQAYYRDWQFRHPSPEDFRASIEKTSHRSWAAHFALLDQKGPVDPARAAHPRKIRPAFLFDARNTDRLNYINLAPAIGYNKYDGAMAGLLIHNYNLPPNAFQFLLAPLYGTNSRQFDGIGRISYTWYPRARFQKIETGLAAEKFSSLSAVDSNQHKLFGGFYKLAPFVRLTFANPDARSTRQAWIEWKTYLIGEKQPGDYVRKSTDSLSYPAAVSSYSFRYLNQLSARIGDTRALYPYAALLQLQQADRFYRVNFTGNYFFNYETGGGMNLRLFAAKFGYLGGNGGSLDLSRFQPKLTGVAGDEDYTYSNYFFGRNEYTGLASQQIMMRDGGLKIRVPNFPFLEGRSDNWVSSLNINTTLPRSIVPPWLPLRAFFDIGTYAGAWQPDPLTSHFLYVGGLQLSLLHDVLHFYIPIFYSGDFSDQLKTLPDQNRFWKKLSFSVNIQDFNIRKFIGGIPL